MSIVVCSLFVVVLLWALISNPDTFSPAKLFLFSFLIFHLGALSGRSSYELWMLMLLVLLVGATTVLLEAVHPLPPPRRYALDVRRHADAKHFVLWIWALSLPAVAGEVFLLWKFGGFEAYVNIIPNRVIEFRGLGWAVTLGATLVTFNLAYFGLGLTRARSRLWWSVYIVHFAMSLAVGLLSGSRGGTLNIFAMQLFAYHYIKGNIRLSRALPAAAALLACAMVLGAVRNSVKFQDDVFTIGLGERAQTLEYSTFQYGIKPLQLLLDADHLDLAYGTTLVSLVTNVVPRDWWPDKPDTGGVFFTKVYTGNAWNGASNLTPTLLGEGIINFGWVMGIAFYVLTYPVLMYLIVTYYLRIAARARAEAGPAAALAVVLYVCVMWSVVGLMIAEVTTILLSLLLTKVAPLVLLQGVLGLSGRTLQRSRGARPLAPRRGLQPSLSG